MFTFEKVPLSLTTHLEMFSFLSAPVPLIRLGLLPPQCRLSSLYQMSSCRQRAGTAYRCAHDGTATGRHPPAANTDLRQHPAHDCLTGMCSLPCTPNRVRQLAVPHAHKKNMTAFGSRTDLNGFNGTCALLAQRCSFSI